MLRRQGFKGLRSEILGLGMWSGKAEDFEKRVEQEDRSKVITLTPQKSKYAASASYLLRGQSLTPSMMAPALSRDT